LFQSSQLLKGLLRNVLSWDYDMKVMIDSSSKAAACGGTSGYESDDEDEPTLVEDPTDFISL
jgi:hypothetical protein